MQKFKVLLFQSLKLKIKKKSFYVSTAIIFLAIILLINLPAFILRNSHEEVATQAVIYSQNQQITDEYLKLYEQQSANMISKYEITQENISPEEFNSSKYSIYLQLDENVLYTKSQTDIPPTDSYLFVSLSSIVQQEQLLAKYNIDQNYLFELSGINMMEIKNVDIENESNTAQLDKKIIAGALNMFILVPIFILIVLVTQIIGLEIADEKASRGMEIIISNVSSKIHMLSKVVSGLIYVFIELATIIIAGFVGIIILKISGGIPDLLTTKDPEANAMLFEFLSDLNFPSYAIYVVIFLLLAISLYSILIAILASGVTSSEDIQKFSTPLMLILVAGFYYSLFTVTFPGLESINIIIGMIPLYNVMMAPMLYLSGTVGDPYMIINILISIITIILVFYLSQNKYKKGLLNYSSEKRANLFSKK